MVVKEHPFHLPGSFYTVTVLVLTTMLANPVVLNCQEVFRWNRWKRTHLHLNIDPKHTKILYYYGLLHFLKMCCRRSGKSTPPLPLLLNVVFFSTWRLLIGWRGTPMHCSLPMAQLLANLAPILLPPPALLILLSSPNWPSVHPTRPPSLPLQNNSDLIWLLSFRLAKATPEERETRQVRDLIKSQWAVVAAAGSSQSTGAD